MHIAILAAEQTAQSRPQTFLLLIDAVGLRKVLDLDDGHERILNRNRWLMRGRSQACSIRRRTEVPKVSSKSEPLCLRARFSRERSSTIGTETTKRSPSRW